MRITRSLKLLIYTLLLFASIFTISKMPALAEWYISRVYPFIATILSFVSAWLPFSLFDMFITLSILAFITVIILIFIKKLKASKGLYLIAYGILIIIAHFYLSWGFAYFRQDFFTRCNIEKPKYRAEDFKSFAYKFVEDANKTYIENKEFDNKEIDSIIETQYKIWSKELKIPYPNGKRKTKKMTYESLQTKMGIAGYFGPFFNEVHVNNFPLAFSYPFHLAHEKAHQFGVASEAEANLYAFIVCATSHNKQLKYSAYISTIAYVLNSYHKNFYDDYNNLYQQIKPEIIADLTANAKHWGAATNTLLADAQKIAYNAYLKTNQISSGTKNYSEVVGLLISVYHIFIQ